MKKLLLLVFASLATLTLCLTSCNTYTPPERPVAYVFPTVRDMESLDQVTERRATVEDVKSWLERAGIYPELQASGLRDEECHLLVRGLARGGYAELDMRKVELPLKWLSISSLADGSVEIMIGYAQDKGKGMRAGMVKMPRIPSATVRRCNLPNMTIGSLWYGTVGSTDREYIELLASDSQKPAFWLKRLVFRK